MIYNTFHISHSDILTMLIFSLQILKGNSDQLTGLLDIGNFDANLKSLNNLYETYVLSVGEFDERIFLGMSLTKRFYI